MIIDPSDALSRVMQMADSSAGTLPYGYRRATPTKFDRACQILQTFRVGCNLLLRRPVIVAEGPRIGFRGGPINLRYIGRFSEGFRLALGKIFLFPVFIGPDAKTRFNNIFNHLRIDRAEKLPILLSMNSLLVYFGKCETQHVVGHIPMRPEGDEALRRHHKGLLKINNVLRGTTAENLIPKLVEYREPSSGGLLLQSRSTGIACSVPGLTEDQFWHRLDLAVQKIGELRKSVIEKESLPESFSDNTTTFSPNFLKNDARILLSKIPVQHTKIVGETIAHLSNWLQHAGWEETICHCDYWMENVLYSEDFSDVVTVIDWEWLADRELLGVDELHCALMSYSIWSKQNIASVIGEVCQEGPRSPTVERLLALLASHINIDNQSIRMISAYLWLRILWRGYVLTDPSKDSWLPSMMELPRKGLESLRTSSVDGKG